MISRFIAACLLFSCLVVGAAERPNVIFILADDMGVGDVAHGGGLAPTPHIDRLAAEGIRFTDAHTTSSVCTPTRYGVITGRYNWRSPLKQGVYSGTSKPLIPPSRQTVAAFLKQQGYRTAIVGKWHLGLGWHKLPEGAQGKAPAGSKTGGGWDLDYTRQVDGGPLALGFDHSFIIPASLDMFPYVYLRDDKPTQVPTVNKKWVREGAAAADFEANQCLRDFAREARAFIETSSQDKSKPFFLYLPLTSPHTPIVPSEAWLGKSKLGAYGDFIMETDWVVGEVMAELDRQKVADNTLLIFTADNGCSPSAKIPDLEKQGHHPCGVLRGHKADIFEGGHRVPFVLRWPQGAKAGATCAQTICLADFYRTAADVLGVADKLPDAVAEDSFSLLPLFKEPGLKEPVRPYTIHHSINGSFSIRQGKWKLALCAGSGGWSKPTPKEAMVDPSLPPVQLYDLEADPAESKNLIGEQPELAATLAALLAKAIRDGRSTPGAPQNNEGWPNTFEKRVVEKYEALKEKS
ncbi:MAG TPA: arylsulfatase [Luteolibacter sp.]|nr:arylsulfatase [Luteolibacter sp.]